ncbi:hypothetical protein [Janthinobacterium sp. PSPC3-1]|uniref:hypothetical protein n=1 Tax=Janthinobacterium sp. PSPC3-1 TaxID=2804653 RepID=UPI003CFB623F
MPYTTFAWLVHCNNEAARDPSLRDVSVNWVMPWGGEAGVQWPAAGASGAGITEQVWKRAGDLLRPWRYAITEWHGIRGDGALAALSAQSMSAAADTLDLWASLERELIRTTAKCERPFSAQSEDLPQFPDADPEKPVLVETNTLPHALAPLTHLPAAVSQDVLGVSRHFRYSDALGDFIAYAPVFNVTIDGAVLTFTPALATIATIAGKLVKVVTTRYQVTDAAGDPAPGHCFSLITQQALAAPAQTGLGSVGIAEADQADIPVREGLLASALNPFLLLTNCLGQIIDDVRQLPTGMSLTAGPAEPMVVDLLGRGLLRIDTVARPGDTPVERHVGVWERIGAGQDAGQAIYAAFEQAPARIALLADLDACRKESGAALPALWTAMKPLSRALLEKDFAIAPWPVGSYGAQRGRGVLSAMVRLLGAATVPQMRAMWFAAMARRFAIDHKGHAFFNDLTFEYWYRRLLPLMNDHFCTLLLAGETPSADAMLWLTEGSSIEDASAARLAEQLTLQAFQQAGHGTPPSAPEKVIFDLLATDAMGRVSTVRVALNGHDHVADVPVSLGEDRDLSVSVAFASADQALALNQEIRGYAVAIAAGASAPEPALSWQWVTDLAAQVWRRGRWEPILEAGDGGKLLRMHDTIGATRYNGRDVVSFPYSGTALNGRLTSIEGGGDPDGVACLDFFWPEPRPHMETWPTPRLAYGLHYWALATPIGNAGRILEQDFADGADDRQRSLKRLDATMFTRFGAKSRYLCRVAPGTPLISLDAKQAEYAYELADESRTRIHLRQSAAGPGADEAQRIALIRDDSPLWRAGSQAISFTIRGPAGTPNVIERWIEADIAAVKLGHASGDTAADGLDAAALAMQQEKYRLLLKPPIRAGVAARPRPSTMVSKEAHEAQWPRHPAVRAFLVEVEFFDASARPAGTASVILSPDARLSSGYVGNATIKVAQGSASQLAAGAGDNAVVTLAPGHFARIAVSSLAPSSFFDIAEPSCRLAAFPGLGNISDRATGITYRRFAPAQHWVECLPKPAMNDAIFAQLARRLLVVPEGRQVVARIDADTGAPLDATWLKAFMVQRHEWHWSGYPVAFPRTASGMAALRDWAEPFIGTESLRESTVWTIQSSVSAGGWNFAGDVAENLAHTELPGEHGAKYVAYVVRPVRRFDRWLQRWPALDATVLAAGLLAPAKVRWDDPGLRLAPPDVRTAVPLVKTFELRSKGAEVRVASGANGCLLCLNDVLYRTDTLARFGGVGESIEVDLEETRFNEIYEIGPNPIFHAAPGESPAAALAGAQEMPRLPYPSLYGESGALSATDPYRKMNWRLEADRAFGLTNDLDRNAKVAQTAMIVHPRGNDVDKYWVMAKVRLRRMLDPSTAWTAPALVPRDATRAGVWTLARRAEGDDWVPHDFCIDAGASSALVALGLPGAASPARFALPVTACATRYLCTWHKGHWANTNKNRWGLQVFIQQLAAEQGQWQTVAHYTPYETWSGLAGFDLEGFDLKDQAPLALQLDAAGLSGAAAQPLSLKRLLVSDYSAPHWLTFIGLPFRDVSFADEHYWVVPDGNGLALKRSNSVRGHAVAIKNGEPISRDLLLLPVEASDFAGTGGAGAVGQESNSFHLLLMFKRVNDVSAPAVGLPLGELIGAYKPVRKAIGAKGTDGKPDPYPALRFESFMAGGRQVTLAAPGDCVGYIYRFHTPHGKGVKAIKDWQELQILMFPHKDPDTGTGPEAGVRWTPEFIGPIALGKTGEWPQGIPVPPQVSGKTIRIESLAPLLPAKHKSVVEIVLDPTLGWRVRHKEHADNLVPEDIISGNCQLDLAPIGEGGLELQVAGGRLLARLAGWPGLAPDAVQDAAWFDREGRPVDAVCQWRVLPPAP